MPEASPAEIVATPLDCKELRPFADPEPFDRIRNLEAIKFMIRMTAENMVEIGRRLIWHKGNVGHGHFMTDLADMNISTSSAARMMNAARKLIGGRVDIPRLGNLGVSKVYALTEELSPAELRELAEGEDVRDSLNLDQFDRMNQKELAEALRKSRTHNKKLQAAQERIRTLKAENEALVVGAGKLSPTLQNAVDAIRRAYEHLDLMIRELNRITVPELDDDECDPEVRGKIVGKLAGFFADWNNRSSNLYNDLVVVHTHDD